MFFRKKKPVEPVATDDKESITRRLIAAQNELAAIKAFGVAKKKTVRIGAPKLPSNVVPEGKKSALAMDDALDTYQYMNTTGWSMQDFQPFPGYPYLASLATRAEFRTAITVTATELTREWIELCSKSEDGSKEDRIKELCEAMEYFDLKRIISSCATNECMYGRGNLVIKVKNADIATPMILDEKTFRKGILEGFASVDPIWVTPSMYNADDPTSPDFYRPTVWFMMGREIHGSRIIPIVTRPLPDILKPSYNFSGMSLSQLGELSVDNWLKTRANIQRLIESFSVTALKTDMIQRLNDISGQSLFDRADLFTQYRNNMGLFLIDSESEDLVQLNTPLSGLSDLQAQAQEHMSSCFRIPKMLFTGISPTGMNSSSDGEVRSWYDYISATQEAYYYQPIDTCLKAIQLHLWGEIDDDIAFHFKPLWQDTDSDLSTERLNTANEISTLINAGVVSAEEARGRLANDPDTAWDNIDIDEIPDDGYEGDVKDEEN